MLSTAVLVYDKDTAIGCHRTEETKSVIINSFRHSVLMYKIITCFRTYISWAFWYIGGPRLKRQSAENNYFTDAMHLSSLFVLSLGARSVLAGMHLDGFDGCGARESQIVDAWHDARIALDATRGMNIDWNEAAALEYLGPPAYNAGQRQAIQGSPAFPCSPTELFGQAIV